MENGNGWQAGWPLALGVVLYIGFALLIPAGFTVWSLVGVLVSVTVAVLVMELFGLDARAALGRLLAVPLAVAVAAAPLLLPILAALVYAARAWSAAAQIVVGMAAAALGVLVVGTQGKGVAQTVAAVRDLLPAWLEAKVRTATAAALVFAAPGLIALVVLLWLALRRHGITDIGGPAGLLEATALALLALTASLRLVGVVSTTKLRFLFVAGFALVVLRFAMAWGFAPGDELAEAIGGSDHTWLVISAAGFAAYAIAEDIWRAAHGLAPDGDPPAWCELARRLGFLTAATATIFVVTAIGVAAKTSKAPSIAHRYRATRVPVITGDLDATKLANRFAPVFVLAKGDWQPSGVAEYLKEMDLWRVNGGQVQGWTHEAGSLPQMCDDLTQAACYLLRCPGKKAEELQECPKGLGRSGPLTVYAHVAEWKRPGDRHVFIGLNRTKWKNELTAIVEYWLFYPYDRWEAVSPVGYFVQEHAADWEGVVVGLGNDEPKFVAYTAHCSGRWYEWDDIETAAGTFNGTSWQDGGAPTHPRVAVGLGSHANYVHAWDGRPPDWGSCAHVPEDATWALTYGGNLRDKTETGSDSRPLKVVVVYGSDPVMGFRGFWSSNDRVSVKVFSPHGLGKPGLGPRSPALKALWNRPLPTIFGPTWKPGRTA